jgi:hypothetical protein
VATLGSALLIYTAAVDSEQWKAFDHNKMHTVNRGFAKDWPSERGLPTWKSRGSKETPGNPEHQVADPELLNTRKLSGKIRQDE